MSVSSLKKFLVLYLVPVDVLTDWANTDPDQRKPAEAKMQAEWLRWTGEHAKLLTLTEAGGKTKAVTAEGISDTKNDIMLYSFIEAESHQAAANAFAQHPHLQIPKSSIQVMEVRAMGAS
jgi:lipopolysaccharide export system protein LptC